MLPLQMHIREIYYYKCILQQNILPCMHFICNYIMISVTSPVTHFPLNTFFLLTMIIFDSYANYLFASCCLRATLSAYSLVQRVHALLSLWLGGATGACTNIAADELDQWHYSAVSTSASTASTPA